MSGRDPVPRTGLWHVTLTVAGEPIEPADIRRALERLAQERPFLLSGRYAGDRAELRYWEEADDLEDAAALALRLWSEHRATAGLPRWRVVGLEVVDRQTFHRRGAVAAADVRLMPAGAGAVRPF